MELKELLLLWLNLRPEERFKIEVDSQNCFAGKKKKNNTKFKHEKYICFGSHDVFNFLQYYLI